MIVVQTAHQQRKFKRVSRGQYIARGKRDGVPPTYLTDETSHPDARAPGWFVLVVVIGPQFAVGWFAPAGRRGR